MSELQKKSDLSTRIVTALLGGILFLTVLCFADSWGSYLIATVISLGMTHELCSITLKGLRSAHARTLMMGVAVTFWVFFYWNTWVLNSGTHYHFLLSSLGIGIIAGLFILSVFFLVSAAAGGEQGLKLQIHDWFACVFTLVYVVALPAFLPMIRIQENGLHLCLLFFVLVWMSDTGAYFSGKFLGRHRLYTLISPKKTWEGVVGGTLTSGVAAFFYNHLSGLGIDLLPLLVMILVINVMTPLGDLCESMIKRAFAVKDSGTWLPGHGGFFDRFDGVIFSLPAMYACVIFFTSDGL